jgi:hypothetical protein
MTDEELTAQLLASLTNQHSNPAEARLLRFARVAAPHVRRRHRKRLAVVTTLFVGGFASTAVAVAPHGLRVGGIEIFVDESQPMPTTFSSPRSVNSAKTAATSTVVSPAAANPTIPNDPTAWPGEPVTVEEAKRRYHSRIRLPRALHSPRAIYWLIPPKTGQVTAVWSPSRNLPATSDPSVGLLFTQFRGTASSQPSLVKKTSVSAAAIEPVTINKVAGTWISGPHTVSIVDDTGSRTESTRVAGSTLIWANDTFTYRLEGNLSKAEAVRIAKSVK